MKRLIAFLLPLLLGGAAFATTWAPSKKTDPLTGERVPAFEIASYGDYIYRWPSKYDLVFWPLIDEKWICINTKTGYAAFNDHFEKVSDEEKKTLAQWLGENYKPSQTPKSHKDKLAWLEKVYRQRKMDDEFWCSFYRLMSYIHRDDRQKSMEYVAKAVPLLEAKLKTDLQGTAKMEVLFLLGEYCRRAGEAEKAKDYFARVKSATYKDDDGKEKVGHPYFLELVRERERPPEGGSSK